MSDIEPFRLSQWHDDRLGHTDRAADAVTDKNVRSLLRVVHGLTSIAEVSVTDGFWRIDMQTGDSSEGLYARLTHCLYIASCGRFICKTTLNIISPALVTGLRHSGIAGKF